MDRDMTLNNFRMRTRRTYLSCVREFSKYHRRDPRRLGDEEIKGFLYATGSIAGGEAGGEGEIAVFWMEDFQRCRSGATS